MVHDRYLPFSSSLAVVTKQRNKHIAYQKTILTVTEGQTNSFHFTWFFTINNMFYSGFISNIEIIIKGSLKNCLTVFLQPFAVDFKWDKFVLVS